MNVSDVYNGEAYHGAGVTSYGFGRLAIAVDQRCRIVSVGVAVQRSGRWSIMYVTAKGVIRSDATPTVPVSNTERGQRYRAKLKAEGRVARQSLSRRQRRDRPLRSAASPC